jgi:hypothetical protein
MKKKLKDIKKELTFRTNLTLESVEKKETDVDLSKQDTLTQLKEIQKISKDMYDELIKNEEEISEEKSKKILLAYEQLTGVYTKYHLTTEKAQKKNLKEQIEKDEYNEQKFVQLARLGLIRLVDVPKAIRAIRILKDGKTDLPPMFRSLVYEILMKLLVLITSKNIMYILTRKSVARDKAKN